MTLSKATVVVLDRDGVINADSDEYIKSPNEWHALPGSLAAIAKLHQTGCRIAVATNQSGVARGYYDLATLADIHGKMLEQVTSEGGTIDRIFFCPHGPDDGCPCRKPEPGLLLEAAEHFACGFDHMIMIGDSERDLLAAQAVGARTILVRTGNGRKTELAIKNKSEWSGLEVHDDLLAATHALINEMND
ncbi:MAG: D-glycero-beta-D-manno-heptose 1,7-bisphosphate 7-phosphatase [Gammaproteobacteria bacterium]